MGANSFGIKSEAFGINYSKTYKNFNFLDFCLNIGKSSVNSSLIDPIADFAKRFRKQFIAEKLVNAVLEAAKGLRTLSLKPTAIKMT